MTPVAVGVQRAMPSLSRTGIPLAFTRMAQLVKVAVKHGPLAAGGGGKVQPAIIHGLDWVTTG